MESGGKAVTKRYHRKLTSALSLVLPVIVLFAILNCFTTYVFYEDYKYKMNLMTEIAAKEEFSGLDAVSELLKDKDIETNEQGRRLLEQYGYWGNKGNAFYMQFRHQVMGYEAGADDYITKPFSLSVLLLKIEAHFRRRQEKTEAGKMISGDIVFIAGEMKVLIKSREISLTKTELKMLTFFLQNPKKILSKTQILENVFDLEGNFVDENTIAVNIRRLREKIEDNPAAPVYIKNIRGLGYIWNQEVRQ